MNQKQAVLEGQVIYYGPVILARIPIKTRVRYFLYRLWRRPETLLCRRRV